MMGSKNPFEEESGGDVGLEFTPSKHRLSPSPQSPHPPLNARESSSSFVERDERISFDAIAKRLLDENLILTSLELHTELIESGRELKRLRDFFSNPANFESQAFPRQGESLARTSSVQTFDSLDFTRCSDEADRENTDRVAVLEFELRKAKETIKSLRDQLTSASEGQNVASQSITSTETLTLVSPTAENLPSVSAPLLPHEQRTLNFLVNEYLLQHDYKLTAVTFSDESPEQDFEDWDEVGLNTPRPADLLSLYRQFLHSCPDYHHTKDVGCYVNLEKELNPFFGQEDIMELDSSTELLNRLNAENAELLERNEALSVYLEKTQTEVSTLTKKLLESENSRTNSVFVEANCDKLSRSSDTAQNSTKNGVASTTASDGFTRTRNLPHAFEKAVLKLATNKPSIGDLRLLSEELIPLILSTVYLHPDGKVRDGLISWLFNLIKKPEEDQRHIILSGCVALTKRVGPTRTEAEILPQCWEQMSHKYPERRILVADACGALAHLVPPALLSSLVLSMLQQMLVEDKSEGVRETVVRSLSLLCLYIEDKDKFSQISDLVQRTLTDPFESVVTAARTLLVPAFGMWAEDIGKLQLGVVSLFTRKISQILQKSGVSQSANESIICSYISCIQALLPCIFWSVLRSGPYAASKRPKSLELSRDRFPSAEFPLESVELMSDSIEELAFYTTEFDRITSEEWYKTWNALDYVLKNMLPELISSLDKLEVGLTYALPAFIRYFRLFSRIFGYKFSSLKLRPFFTPSLTLPPLEEGVSQPVQHLAISYATLPVYCAGVLSAFGTEEDWRELRRFLRAQLLAVAERKGPPNAMAVTFLELCQYWPNQEELVGLVHELLANRNPDVRAMCAYIFSRLVPRIELSLLREKVLPGLVSLSTDNDRHVKVNAVMGFGAILDNSVSEEDVMEKVRFQLSSLFDEPDYLVIVPLIRVMAQVAPNLDAAFRDEFVLPQLAVISVKNNVAAYAEGKRPVATALFEAYSALSCCFLSPDALTEAFIPGLRSVIKDLDVEHVKIATSILKDAETKAPITLDKRGSVGPEMAVEELRSRMVNRLRDFKGKMDQHTTTVPNIFKKK